MAAGKLDLNTASVVHLRAIKGLGPSRAEEIVRYRSKKGAFASVDELNQVPHVGDMPPEELEQVKRQFTVSTAPSGQRSEKINVNKANAAELRQIPGVGESHAEAIVQYRQDHGPIRNLDELDLIPHLRERSTLERQRIKNALEV
ncbi:MAG TPA: helix-hairpin-helix domain-containing protein [Xanthobacteraceae bacterium]|jgi:competence protein ComEA|nr:helix-hairpin-helix domain-containing protein [Xanthobacteraceae bacterium]